MLTTALAMLLSAAYVRIRDIAIIWGVLSTILFYASPILYPIEVAPQEFRDLISLNPLTPIFEQTREWIIDPNAPGAVESVAGKEWLLAISFGIAALVCFLGPLDLQPDGAAGRRGALATGRLELAAERRRDGALKAGQAVLGAQAAVDDLLRPARPVARASSGSESRRRTAAASAAGSSGSTISADSPSRSSSGIAPTRVTTDGLPAIAASNGTRPKGSLKRAGLTTTSAAA